MKKPQVETVIFDNPLVQEDCVEQDSCHADGQQAGRSIVRYFQLTMRHAHDKTARSDDVEGNRDNCEDEGWIHIQKIALLLSKHQYGDPAIVIMLQES